MRPLVLTVALAAFALASAWSVRVGIADYWARQATVTATDKALALAPWRSDYYVQLAVLLSDDNPKESSQALRRAIALNPSDSLSWIELGLNVEEAGDPASAEQYFLHAAEVDHEYLPKWTLANYYLRRNDESKFWFWAKEAAQMLYGDSLPLFRMCGKVSEDGKLIDRLDIRKPAVQADYLSYLLNQKRLDLIGPATQHLLAQGRDDDVPLLLAACDRLIEAKMPGDALTLWNGLAKARKIPYSPIDPDGETILSHDSFVPTAVSEGFAWRLPPLAGISASREENPPGLRLVFSGDEPEACTPLVRFLPVRENSAYELTVSYRTAGIDAGSGLAWSVRTLDGLALATEPQSLSAENGGQARIRFTAPAGCHMVRIDLAYQRALGTTRIDGSIVLQEAGLRRVAQLPDKTPGRVMK